MMFYMHPKRFEIYEGIYESIYTMFCIIHTQYIIIDYQCWWRFMDIRSMYYLNKILV